MICLPAEKAELVRRLISRNGREGANTLRVRHEALEEFFRPFDPQFGGQATTVDTGDLDAVLAGMQ